MHLSRASSPSLILQTKTPKHGLPYDLYLAEPTTCHSNDADHVSTIKDYRSKIENELSSICDGILKLLDTKFSISKMTHGLSSVSLAISLSLSGCILRREAINTPYPAHIVNV
ncbi:hypothetical protein CsSME_00051304 [Camellia sinensis var. sinensis]